MKADATVPGAASRARCSVIVRTHNECAHLGRLIERTRRQTWPPDEIIVVDSGSTDGTVGIAERDADHLVRLNPDDFTFGRSLNKGCRAAKGDILVIASAHTYPVSNNWLRNLVEPFLDPVVGMVYGRQLPGPATRVGEAREFDLTFPAGSHVLVDSPYGNNANAAIRAELWREHPYDERLPGLEDIEMARFLQRRGFVVHYAANAGIVHIHDESARQVYRRFFREGEAWGELHPHSSRSAIASAAKALADLVRDLRFWRRTAAPPSELFDIPRYRIPAAVGFHRGVISRGKERAGTADTIARRRAAGNRAVTIAGPGSHLIEPRSALEPAPGEAVVRVAYVGVCATDVEIADGRQAYYESGVAEYPIVPGHEYSGVVEVVGSDRDRELLGARVVGECILGCGACPACESGAPTRCERREETGVLRRDGAYATQLRAPVGALHRLPDTLPLGNASLAEPTAVILKALRKVGDVRGRRCTVVGAGPIGHLTALILRERGADVLVLDPDERRLRLLQLMDISTADEADPDLADAFLTVEATGSDAVLDELGEALSSGTVLVLGRPGADGEVPPSAPERTNAQFIGSLGSDPQDWPEAVRMLASGVPTVKCLTAHVEPLEAYAEAWDAVRERSRLKTLLSIEPELADH